MRTIELLEEQERQLERAANERRYIEAKIDKFELDQVTKPFAQTRRDQGLGRAVRGMLQRKSLEAIGQLDKYVAWKSSAIQREREQVAAFEKEQDSEMQARTLYHSIRDEPLPQTYKDTRRAFRKIKFALALEETGITGERRAAVKEWMQYYQQGLIAATIGVVLATGVTVPVHEHNETKDHSRPVHYKKYDRQQTHPMIKMAIAANNLEMYLHETWNHTGKDGMVASWVAQEWDDFIKPGANDFNLKYTDSDAGNDWSRPWGSLFEEAKQESRVYLRPLQAPVQTLRDGMLETSDSWPHSAYDVEHPESYDCGTTEKPQTCTKMVYDYTVHNWSLDAAQLRDGALKIEVARRALPEIARADSSRLLEFPSGILQFVRGKSKDEVRRELELRNQWSRSVMIDAHQQMTAGMEQLRRSGLPMQVADDARTYPQTYTNISYVHVPTSYPTGWAEHERIIDMARAITRPNRDLHNTLAEFDRIIPRVQKDMDVLGSVSSVGSPTNRALRDLANAAYDVHNANYTFKDWHPTYGTRIMLEWLLFLGIAAGAGFGSYYAMEKRRDYSFTKRLSGSGIEFKH
jgi:hypothetical protein